MNTANAEKTFARYAPRHLSRPYAPRHAAPTVPLGELIKVHASAAYKRLVAFLCWVNIQLEKDMNGPSLALCGALMGLILWPVIFYCLFA